MAADPLQHVHEVEARAWREAAEVDDDVEALCDRLLRQFT